MSLSPGARIALPQGARRRRRMGVSARAMADFPALSDPPKARKDGAREPLALPPLFLPRTRAGSPGALEAPPPAAVRASRKASARPDRPPVLWPGGSPLFLVAEIARMGGESAAHLLRSRAAARHRL